MNEPTLRFTCLVIPAEILDLEELTLFEVHLLAYVDALYCPNHGGCFASNEYLAKKMRGAKVNTVAKAITKLRSMGLIEDVSFNGRKRVIRACIGKTIEKVQSKSALDLNPSLGWIKIQPCIGQKSKSGLDKNPSGVPLVLIHDSKEDIKDKYIAESAEKPTQSATPLRGKEALISFSFTSKEFENITAEDLQQWQVLYESIDINRELMEMKQWILSNPSKAKAKKLWRKFIVGWLQRANEKSTNRLAYQKSKEREVLSRHIGLQKDNRPRNPNKVHDYSQWKPDGTT